MLDPQTWNAVPFHFWSLVIFVFGCIVGSLLNVCIYRMPRGESVIFPPSHCPHCTYAIPWYLNMPLITWLILRGRCAECKAPISFRYFLVELLTGLLFLGSWLAHGRGSYLLPLVYCLFIAGLIIATFIDFEHFIIPDEITIGGMIAGFLLSAAVPAMHAGLLAGDIPDWAVALRRSALGIAIGAGVVYGILRLGKMMFGRQKIELEADTKILFTESAMVMPDHEVPYEEIFYRKSDTLVIEAKTVELPDRCYFETSIKLSPDQLVIGEEIFKPDDISQMTVVTSSMTVPREAMGFGDVKFMGAIGAFLGWEGAIFSLMISAVLGSIVGVTLILFRKQEWSSRLPYGPYIALAALIWIYGGRDLTAWWFSRGLMIY